MHDMQMKNTRIRLCFIVIHISKDKKTNMATTLGLKFTAVNKSLLHKLFDMKCQITWKMELSKNKTFTNPGYNFHQHNWCHKYLESN